MSNQVSILFHSGYGHTEKVAHHIAAGAKGAGASVNLVKIDADGNLSDAQWEMLDKSDAIIMGSPTYMGAASWQFKKVADASSKRWMTGTWINKVGAGFTNSAGYSGDKLSTINQISVLAMQHGMIWVGNDVRTSQYDVANVIPEDAMNRIGSYSGLMTQSHPMSSAEMSPPSGDLKTAEAFGKRVAELSAKLLGSK
ncbi:MAG: flavodoxin family protein [Alphaproteobacteria bacterium]|jgi:NAD(P)H dehydrogenase (quinone)|nr:NAD(P)H-dependent oxidoreductase [Candidatus Jidaibacter sp.]